MSNFRKFSVLKAAISLALLVWVVNFFVLIFFWNHIPIWLKWGIAFYQFVVASDARIFQVPFMTEAEFTSIGQSKHAANGSQNWDGGSSQNEDKNKDTHSSP